MISVRLLVFIVEGTGAGSVEERLQVACLIMMNRRAWKAFEEWQREYQATHLPELTAARAFEIAHALYQHAWLVAPASMRSRREQSAEDTLASDDLQRMMRVRRVFEAHARRLER